jgi:hypothetical protein
MIAAGLTLIYNNYEIGYIQNDCMTIRLESRPTLRVSARQLSFYENNNLMIYGWRLFVSLLISGFMERWPAGSATSSPRTEVFILLAWSILPAFLLYNKIRSRWNLPMHFVLVCLRFGTPFFLMTSSWISVSLSILLFPLLNLTERMTEPRFGLVWTRSLKINDCNEGRHWYYALLTSGLFIAVIVIADLRKLLIPFLSVSSYLFLYRKFSSMWVRNAER